jgi:hypothetical protein
MCVRKTGSERTIRRRTTASACITISTLWMKNWGCARCACPPGCPADCRSIPTDTIGWPACLHKRKIEFTLLDNAFVEIGNWARAQHHSPGSNSAAAAGRCGLPEALYRASLRNHGPNHDSTISVEHPRLLICHTSQRTVKRPKVGDPNKHCAALAPYTRSAEVRRRETALETRYRILLMVCLMLALIAGGTIGFHFVQRWDWFESFYGTLMTISTIGAEPENQLSRAGESSMRFLSSPVWESLGSRLDRLRMR